MKRRILAALMCLCMLVGLLPTTVFAAWGGGHDGQSQEAVEVAFYYIYTNKVPIKPQSGPEYAIYYGPSSNDTPLVKTTVNVDTLFSKLGSENRTKAQSLWNNGMGYITAASCGYTDNATWWGLVVSCMDEDGQDYFTNDSFGKLFQGYVLKYAKWSNTNIHCDGIITEAPPLYLVELEDVTNNAYVGTMSSSTETGNTVSSIQAKFKTHLEAIYDSGTIDWTDSKSGTFTTGNTSYKISLQYTPALTGTLLRYEQIAGVNGGNYYRAIVKMTVTECYTVTYDANGGTDNVPTDSNTYSAGDTVTVKFDSQPTKTGYTFLGWDRSIDAKDPEFKRDSVSQTFNINENTTLYAIWQANDPGLAVEKTAALVNADGSTTSLGDNGEVTVGDTIRYTVTVSNSGGPAENVQVSDGKFPSGGTGVTVTPAGSASWNENGYYTIGSLGVNGSVAFTYDYTVTSGDAATGSIQNTATVQYASEEPITDGVTVTVKDPETTVSKIAVSLSKDALAQYGIQWEGGIAPDYTPVTVNGNNRTLTVGDVSNVTLLYVVTLTAADTNAVTVTDAGATYVGYQSVGDNTVTVKPGVGDTYTVTWTTEGTTESPAKAYLYFTKTVEVNESLDEIVNTVTVNNDKTATSTVPVYQVKSVNKEVLTSVPQGVTAPQNLANFIQVGGQPTVLIPANAKQVALLYKITVTGTQGATFTVEDNGAVFWSGSAWNGTGTGTIGSSGTYELYCYKTFDKDSGWGTSLINTATVLGRTDTEETPVKVAQGVITVTPVDMTAYMGGTSSYWEDMDGTYVPEEESGIPAPRFYVELNGKNASENLVFHGTDSTGETAKEWSLELYSDDATRYVWHIRGVAGADNASCMYFADETLTEHVTTDKLGTGEFNHLYATISTSDSTGAGNTNLYATDGENYYTLAMGVGSLYIREVTTEGETYPAAKQAEEATKDGTQAGVVIPEGTTFTVNGKDGWTLDGENKNVSLLFDEVLGDVIAEDGSNLLETAIVNNAEKLGLTIRNTTQYESKYLDLVDGDDGNVWVKASNILTVYWPYPDGITYKTAQSYDFSLFHFTGMHREDRSFVTASSMIEQAVQNINGEKTEVTNNDVLSLTKENITLTENGIQFTVDQSKAGFSPFVLVYDTKSYTIDASAGAGGSISPSGSVTVSHGGNQTFTITANNGYHISDVKVDGVSVGAVSNYPFDNVTANHTIVATFAKDDDGHHSKYTLYYHSNFGKDQQANEGTDDDEVVVKDYEELKILPERDGYVFVSWNTEEDGSGTRYLPGDVFDLTKSEHHLYAQWQKDKTGPDDSGVSNWLETDDHNAYLSGYPDSTFRADRNMTRAEVAQMFYALLLDKNVTITKSFSDVPDDAWYATAVKTLASLGMMDGYPDGTFRPDEPITRAEFATVGLAFAYDPLDASCSYYDVGANAWYYTYVAQATTYGWIGGYPDNTFRPGNNITRVEVCVIVNNMLGRDADERYIDRNEDELVHFVDLSDSYWGYYTIMESTNTHEYTGSFTNEKWTDVK